MKAGAACRCARGCPRTTPRHASPAPWAETAFCTPVHFENGLCVWIFRLENHGASRAGPPTCANAGCLIAHTGKRASDFKHEGRFRSERGVKNMAAAVPVGSRPEAVFGRPGGDGPCGLLRKQGRPPWNAGRFSKTARIGPHAGCFGNIRPQIARRFSKTARIDWHAGYFGNKGGSRRPLFSKTARAYRRCPAFIRAHRKFWDMATGACSTATWKRIAPKGLRETMINSLGRDAP